jgi:5-oxoprolinase (ATP-hydrolysing) subunit A
MKIDLNSDLGEGFGRWKSGDDEALMKVISSANVACGFHGGDALIMTRMTEAAKENNVALGAHVGLPDLLGFGRVAMDIHPRDFAKHALYQLGALAAIAQVGGYKVTHAGSHGALGDMSKRNPEYRELMFDAFAAEGAMKYARKLGLRTVGKIFADRAYDDEGHLVSRKLPGALITDLEVVAQRMDQFMNDQTITSMSGKRIKMDAACVLVHSDTTGALEIAKTVRATVEKGGGKIVPLTELAN